MTLNEAEITDKRLINPMSILNNAYFYVVDISIKHKPNDIFKCYHLY